MEKASVLVFCPTKKDCEETSRKVAKYLLTDARVQQIKTGELVSFSFNSLYVYFRARGERRSSAKWQK